MTSLSLVVHPKWRSNQFEAKHCKVWANQTLCLPQTSCSFSGTSRSKSSGKGLLSSKFARTSSSGENPPRAEEPTFTRKDTGALDTSAKIDMWWMKWIKWSKCELYTRTSCVLPIASRIAWMLRLAVRTEAVGTRSSNLGWIVGRWDMLVDGHRCHICSSLHLTTFHWMCERKGISSTCLETGVQFRWINGWIANQPCALTSASTESLPGRCAKWMVTIW